MSPALNVDFDCCYHFKLVRDKSYWIWGTQLILCCELSGQRDFTDIGGIL